MAESIAEVAEFEGSWLVRQRASQVWARRLLWQKLEGLDDGQLRLVEAEQERIFGRANESGLVATVRVRDPRFYSAVVFGGSIGAGEAYMAGHWQADDLTAVARILLRNRQQLLGLDRGWGRSSEPLHRLVQWLRANTRRGSRRNIAAHYDLGNEFFALFLDRRMMYSSAVFERPEATLDEASEVKLERICRKLDLQPEDHVLEIGSGWGGFALYAASRFGCRVTTTTISPAQHRQATAAVEAAGLSERVTVLQRDYRDLTGTYDKLVSIEMIEAVGHRFLPGFFRHCADRLAPHGLMLLQAITLAEPHFERARRRVDFIQRYIFPGSAIPSVGSLAAAMAQTSDFTLVHLEDIGLHYAETLRCWRQRFLQQGERLRQLGFSEVFRRMWEFYFAYCEAGFRERTVGDVQMVLAKPGNRRPPILGRLAQEGR